VPHIIVAGAGIGGLCAAIAIRRQGFAVTVLEKQPSPREVGAGLGLWVNAVRALKRIGVGDLVESIAVPDGAGGFFDDRGRLLAIVFARTFVERFGAPSFSRTPPRVPGSSLAPLRCHDTRERHRIRVRQTDDGVTVTCADGHEFKADLLVGADGIRSVVRRELGHPSRLRYSGTVAYRGVTELAGSGLPMDGGFWGIYLARGVQTGCGPVSNGQAYWFVSVNGPAGGPQGPGAHRDEALAHISPRLGTMRRLVAATPDGAILRNDVYDLPPIPRWSRGRVTLLGDAAAIGRALSETKDVRVALASYETARVARCNRVTRTSRILGRFLQTENPLLSWVRNTTLARGSEASRFERLAWLLDYEPQRTDSDWSALWLLPCGLAFTEREPVTYSGPWSE
jgi:2-polyprenyl-6-methoxyphenol hydroxylase-like FAD-dependent oxidoreductase